MIKANKYLWGQLWNLRIRNEGLDSAGRSRAVRPNVEDNEFYWIFLYKQA